MTSPPGTARNSSITARLADKGTSSQINHALARRLVDAGCWVAQQRGVPMRRRRVRELVNRFIESGRSDLINEQRTVDDFRSWFITYADPTGETAVRNVTKGIV